MENYEEVIERFISEAEIDLKINHDALDSEIVKQSLIFSKWYKRFRKINYKYALMLKDAEDLKSKLYLFYTGRASIDEYKEKTINHKFLKSESDNAIGNDIDWQKLQRDLVFLKELSITLEGIIERIRSKDWQLKNLLEYKKFEAGM